MQVVHLQYPSFAFSFAACVGRDGKVLFHHAIFRGEFAAPSFPLLIVRAVVDPGLWLRDRSAAALACV